MLLTHWADKKLCLRLRRLSISSAGLAGDVTSAGLSLPGVSWSKTCNGSNCAICMQQHCRPLAAVFSVISKSCIFMILSKITE